MGEGVMAVSEYTQLAELNTVDPEEMTAEQRR